MANQSVIPDKAGVKELSGLAFVAEAANILMLEPPGVGKTHLAAALGKKAIERLRRLICPGLRADRGPQEGPRGHNLDRRLRVCPAPKSPAVEQSGIRPCDRQAVTTRFTLMSSRYERGRFILTSNQRFGKRGELPGGTVVASPVPDRLPHTSHAPNVQSESCPPRSKRHAGFFSPHHLPEESPDNDSDTGSFLRRR